MDDSDLHSLLHFTVVYPKHFSKELYTFETRPHVHVSFLSGYWYMMNSLIFKVPSVQLPVTL